MTRLIPVARGLLTTFAGAPTPARIARARSYAAPARGRTETVRWFLQPADHLLDATFRSERLKAALAWLASQSGPPPHEPGTVGHLSWIGLMHLRAPGRPIGGSGELSRALAERLARPADGSGPATRRRAFTINAGAVTGVRTRHRAHRAGARRAVRRAHPRHARPARRRRAEPPGVRARIRSATGSGPSIRLATEPCRLYPGAPADALNGMQLLVTDRAELRAAYADFLAARPPERPAVLALTPTAQDPSLAPPGRHAVTLWAQWHRYDLADPQLGRPAQGHGRDRDRPARGRRARASRPASWTPTCRPRSTSSASSGYVAEMSCT